MNSKVENLLAATTGEVKRQLHGSEGERKPDEFLRRVRPYIERGITADPKGIELNRLEKWLLNDPDGLKNDKLNRYLELSLGIYNASEQESGISEIHFGVPGHDMENVIHTTTEILRMIDSAGSDLGDYTKWELLICGLNENLGRLIEGDDYTHRATGFLLARSFVKKLEVGPYDMVTKVTEEERLIARRVMGRIYDHGGQNSGDPVSDLVRQSNTVQQVEPRLLRRSIEYDVAQVGLDILSPIDPERQTSLAHAIAEKPDKTPTLMDWVEFFARNLYPFMSEANENNENIFKTVMRENQDMVDVRRANSVAVLVILAGGEDTELFQQVFAPELELIEPNQAHWTKKRFPEQVFQEGLKKYREFVQNHPNFPGLEGMDDKKQIAAILEVMSSYLPEDLLGKIYKKYDGLDEDEQKRLVDALRHSLYLHYEELDKELEMLGRQVKSDNPHVAKVAGFAKDYLDSKNRLDKSKESEGESIKLKLCGTL
ncbi:MAG: hypothetical protein UV59_C0033G0006 [Candidatus Gottesmanbacteria bacterium GW2011_GWA1_43_11]|uniref:Uncharacterized protein n=1 Tax=Candidatus Gottesmanbacteria bacterium GW2011_GWA1_43_11 TaxID=1618436 RepID=A0A0G1FA29_9BACT|nr:MAG: hypothetical protein UV59_C0033G0006 [Candidatus Gottesmanbacteria bacterium GW2011_GWA1_43_11]